MGLFDNIENVITIDAANVPNVMTQFIIYDEFSSNRVLDLNPEIIENIRVHCAALGYKIHFLECDRNQILCRFAPLRPIQPALQVINKVGAFVEKFNLKIK